MGEVSNESYDGYINLNVRVHRDDIASALGFDSTSEEELKKLTPKEKAQWKKLKNRAFFKAIAQKMADNEPFSGGDMFSDSCREAYEAAEEQGDSMSKAYEKLLRQAKTLEEAGFLEAGYKLGLKEGAETGKD